MANITIRRCFFHQLKFRLAGSEESCLYTITGIGRLALIAKLSVLVPNVLQLGIGETDIDVII